MMNVFEQLSLADADGMDVDVDDVAGWGDPAFLDPPAAATAAAGSSTGSSPTTQQQQQQQQGVAYLSQDYGDPSINEPVVGGGGGGSNATAAAEKPYHSKRPHKKSRAGCRNCKARKVKCDEARPACRSCVLRRAECVYPTTPSAFSSSSSSSSSSGARVSRSAPSPPSSSSSLEPESFRAWGLNLAQPISAELAEKRARAAESAGVPLVARIYREAIAVKRERLDESSSREKSTMLLTGADDDDCYYDTADADGSIAEAEVMQAALAMVKPVEEPHYMPPAVTDEADMRLLWFYTTNSFQSFAPDGGRGRNIDEILRVHIVQHAFGSRFLMDSVLGLSAMHLQYLGKGSPNHRLLGISPARAIAYRARAFEGYRKAIEAANPSTFPALLACSLMLCALSSQMFRDPDTTALYVVDWMVVWRGIGLIIDLIKPQALIDSGMASLFYRPRLNLDATAASIPNYLLFMVSSVAEGDRDRAYVATYYDTLKYLGSLYAELDEKGFSPILDLRLITFFTFVPTGFIALARERRPRALVILAHYLAFTKIIDRVWWMEDISDREINTICALVAAADPRRHDAVWDTDALLRVPKLVAGLAGNKLAIARAILDNSAWTPPKPEEGKTRDHFGGLDEDPRIADLAWVDDVGMEVEVQGDVFARKGGASPGSPAVRHNRQMMSGPDSPETARNTSFSPGGSTLSPPSLGGSGRDSESPARAMEDDNAPVFHHELPDFQAEL